MNSDVKELLNWFINCGEKIDLENHNFDICDQEWITLADVVADYELARNNCFPISWAICEESDGVFDHQEIAFNDGMNHHFNTYISPDGHLSIIDFTAHQYSSEIPVPYVGSLEEWAKLINKHASKMYGEQATITKESLNKLQELTVRRKEIRQAEKDLMLYLSSKNLNLLPLDINIFTSMDALGEEGWRINLRLPTPRASTWPHSDVYKLRRLATQWFENWIETNNETLPGSTLAIVSA